MDLLCETSEIYNVIWFNLKVVFLLNLDIRVDKIVF